MGWYRWEGDTLILTVRVQIRASRDEIGAPESDHLKVRITAPPVAGKANRHLIRFLGREFKVAPNRIRLLSGETRRIKRLAIPAPGALIPAISRPKIA